MSAAGVEIPTPSSLDELADAGELDALAGALARLLAAAYWQRLDQTTTRAPDPPPDNDDDRPVGRAVRRS